MLHELRGVDEEDDEELQLQLKKKIVLGERMKLWKKGGKVIECWLQPWLLKEGNLETL